MTLDGPPICSESDNECKYSSSCWDLNTDLQAYSHWALPISIIQSNSKLLSGFRWPIIFKPEKIKLMKEYESVTQKVLLLIESILQNAI
jgi:hypothetical protein